MTIKEVYRQVLLTVADVTTVSIKDITGKGRQQEIVDARWIVVIIMHEKGFYAAQISRLMKMSERHVDRIIKEYPDRLQYGGLVFRTNYRAVRDILL